MSRWVALEPAGLRARALRVARRDISYFKYLFESYEGVAILRTVQTLDPETAIVAVLAPPDQVGEAEAILRAVEDARAPWIADEELPPACHEDWFLEAWVRDDEETAV